MSTAATLRNQVYVRLAAPDEPYLAWFEANKERNDFDPAVLGYPTTKVLAAYKLDGTVLAYMPVQTVAMLESIATNPEVGSMKRTAGVVEMTQAAAMLASLGGIRECFFCSTDDLTAGGAELMGFEELPYKVYRLRIK